MKDRNWKTYLAFLVEVLGRLNNFNNIFQEKIPHCTNIHICKSFQNGTFFSNQMKLHIFLLYKEDTRVLVQPVSTEIFLAKYMKNYVGNLKIAVNYKNKLLISPLMLERLQLIFIWTD